MTTCILFILCSERAKTFFETNILHKTSGTGLMFPAINLFRRNVIAYRNVSQNSCHQSDFTLWAIVVSHSRTNPKPTFMALTCFLAWWPLKPACILDAALSTSGSLRSISTSSSCFASWVSGSFSCVASAIAAWGQWSRSHNTKGLVHSKTQNKRVTLFLSQVHYLSCQQNLNKLSQPMATRMGADLDFVEFWIYFSFAISQNKWF